MTANAPLDCIVVEFDHRSDGGPRHVGPFTSKAVAQDWLEWQTFDYEADFIEVTMADAPTVCARDVTDELDPCVLPVDHEGACRGL